MTDDFAAQRARLMTKIARLRAHSQWDQADELDNRFRGILPEIVVARCPLSGIVVRWPIDTAGLDSAFWEYRMPCRRTPELPATWLAMTGAMRLAEPVEQPPFMVVPDPGAPFVVPRILRGPGVRAVIAEVPIGRHIGWTISYFGPKPPETNLVNVWGADTYPVYRDGVWKGWNAEHPDVREYDFDLAPWLSAGALSWIAPGDESATLREGVSGCPFVDLPGDRRITVMENGAIHHATTVVGPTVGCE